jgi:hypothetical protein
MGDPEKQICHRSEWFRKAFGGKFQVSRPVPANF